MDSIRKKIKDSVKLRIGIPSASSSCSSASSSPSPPSGSPSTLQRLSASLRKRTSIDFHMPSSPSFATKASTVGRVRPSLDLLSEHGGDKAESPPFEGLPAIDTNPVWSELLFYSKGSESPGPARLPIRTRSQARARPKTINVESDRREPPKAQETDSGVVDALHRLDKLLETPMFQKDDASESQPPQVKTGYAERDANCFDAESYFTFFSLCCSGPARAKVPEEIDFGLSGFDIQHVQDDVEDPYSLSAVSTPAYHPDRDQPSAVVGPGEKDQLEELLGHLARKLEQKLAELQQHKQRVGGGTLPCKSSPSSEGGQGEPFEDDQSEVSILQDKDDMELAARLGL